MKNWLSQFLKKYALWKRKDEMALTEDAEIEQFFTNSEYASQIFEKIARSTPLTKRLLVIHGIGGVGKSTLLRMYRLACRRFETSIALINGEEMHSIANLLANWANDLSKSNVNLPAFQTTLARYRALQGKVEAEAGKADSAKKQATNELGKAIAKTAIETALGAIPVVGPLVSSLGGVGAEAFMEWLHGFLSKADLEFYLDPTKRLTDDFLQDLKRVASSQRIVLMADTYEHMTTLDNGMSDLVRRLPSNVLVVIAGRVVPDWDRTWSGWMALAEIVELKEMKPEDLSLLVRRYYTHIRGSEPDPKQVKAISQFARGLPMVATTVVKLWVRHGVEDFQTVKPQVVADLVDRLLEGVPPEMRPVFELATLLRYFNVDTLRALLEGGNADELYAELRQWPFIRPRREGLAVHDTMREMMNEGLRARTPSRFRTLHERAVTYYEEQLKSLTGDERERYMLERLYHRIGINEEDGLRLFQDMAEELARFWLTNRLRTLLNDVNTYPLERENSRLWREYYNARLAYLEGHRTTAEKVYQAIGENEQVEPKLRAYALCDWGEVLGHAHRLLGNPQGADQAIQIVQRSLRTAPLDAKTVSNFRTLRGIYELQNAWLDARSAINQILQFYLKSGDMSGQADAYFTLRWHYYLVGDFKQMLIAHDAGNEAAMSFLYLPFIKMKTLRTTIGWVEIGRYAEVERNFREALRLLPEIKTDEFESEMDVNLALALGAQRKFQEAHQQFEKALAIRREAGDEFFLGYWETFWGRIFLLEGDFNQALSHLKISLDLKHKLRAYLDIPETLNLLGELYELRQEWNQAEDYYRQSLDQHVGRRYLEAYALAGLLRVKYAQGQSESAVALFAEAENLAQQYEYNNHLASLNLIKGHLAWKEPGLPKGSGFESALPFYQQAFIYALRYNRFLLDEVLGDGGVATPWRSLIPFCREEAEEGRRMLTALRDWWQTGATSIGAPRSDTISPISENIPLLQAERIARQREIGDNSPQQTVVERINAALLTTRHDG